MPDQNAFPELMAHLVVRLGEILYGQYVWAIQHMSDPALMLGDDPVLLLNMNEPARSGSYSQVATSGQPPISLWLSPSETVERALAAMRNNHMVAMPLGPQDLLTLSPTTLMKPGRYDVPGKSGNPYNAMLGRASQRWICSTPADGAGEPTAAAIKGAADFGRTVMREEARLRHNVG